MTVSDRARARLTLDRRQILLGGSALGATWLSGGLARAQQDAAPAQRLAQLRAKLERAEALRAVRRVQNAYAQYCMFGRWSDAAALFTRDALMRDRDGAALGPADIAAHLQQQAGAEGEGLAPGHLNAVMVMSPVLNVSASGARAYGRWHEVAMLGRHGDNATWRGGIYENEYAQEDGVWKIAFSNYYGRFAGPYEAGWRNTPNGGDIVPFHYDPRGAGTPIPALPSNIEPVAEADMPQVLASVQTRIACLTDEAEICNLQNAYGYYLDRKMWDDVADLFVADGLMERDNEGGYFGRDSIRRGLDRFGPAGLAAGELNDRAQIELVVSLSPDGMTATGRGVELAMTGQDNATGQWSVSVFENVYVKEDGVWKFQRMRILPHMKADYAAGWAEGALPPAGPSAEFPPDGPARETVSAYPDALAMPYSLGVPGAPQAAMPAPPVADVETILAKAERAFAVAAAYDGAENISNAYGYYIDEFQWDESALIFSEEGWKELSYVGAYVGRERVRDSLKYRYGLGGRTGPNMTLHQKIQPVITVAPDGRSARIRERLFQLNSSPAAPGSYIGGIYENEVELEAGVWKIAGMDLDYVWLGDYATGWTGIDAARNARYAPSPDFLEQFPPDRELRGVVFAPFPEVAPMGFHYVNPVSGREPPRLLPPGGAPLPL